LNAGIVDEDIDAVEAGERCLRLIGHGDVADQPGGLVPLRLQLVHRCGKRRLVASVQRDPSSGGRKSACHGKAEAAARTGEDGVATAQIEKWMSDVHRNFSRMA
jgi:hypothetical protein